MEQLFKTQDHPPEGHSAIYHGWDRATDLERRIDRLTESQKAQIDRRLGFSKITRAMGYEPEPLIVVNRLYAMLRSRYGLRRLAEVLPRVHPTHAVETGAAL